MISTHTAIDKLKQIRPKTSREMRGYLRGIAGNLGVIESVMHIAPEWIESGEMKFSHDEITNSMDEEKKERIIQKVITYLEQRDRRGILNSDDMLESTGEEGMRLSAFLFSPWHMVCETFQTGEDFMGEPFTVFVICLLHTVGKDRWKQYEKELQWPRMRPRMWKHDIQKVNWEALDAELLQLGLGKVITVFNASDANTNNWLVDFDPFTETQDVPDDLFLENLIKFEHLLEDANRIMDEITEVENMAKEDPSLYKTVLALFEKHADWEE